MPFEIMLPIAGITLVFVTFGVMLLWGDLRTRDMSR